MADRAPSVLILTPVKDAAGHLETYASCLERLSWPKDRLSIGLLESDSSDGTWEMLHDMAPRFEVRASRLSLAKHDFGLKRPPWLPRYHPVFQLPRRSVLAKARNRLIFAALRDEDWVLWIDVDVIDYPRDVLDRLLATGRDVVQPHCVLDPGGPTFDRNAWRSKGTVYMEDLRGQELVKLDTVGGTMLLVRADLHREGALFPSYPYGLGHPGARLTGNPAGEGGELETEGFGLVVSDMGYQCWGMPDLEIIHARS